MGNRWAPTDTLLPMAAQRMGAEAHDDPPAPYAAIAGTAGNHDKRVRPHPRAGGEGRSSGDGTVRQQHHLRAVPIPQPAGRDWSHIWLLAELHPLPQMQHVLWY